ncbi:MAG: phytanoyl-CoA dioxygenase family protein [Planctomycetes bacterium]|nr:phytanoyl-CoA dioxygenase family protein [Planctomycetota bacterium]
MPEADARYPLRADQLEAFHRDGWMTLHGFLDEAELLPLEQAYMRLLRREVPVRGRDYCDMTGDYTRPIEQYEILNVMLPRVYLPELGGNVYERRAADVTRQLLGDGFAIDYDQLVAKPPGRSGAVFHWHQDLGYWPITEDTRTATFWLALDDIADDNGGVRFVDGSHREPALREHLPLQGDRDSNHTLMAQVDPDVDRIRSTVMKRGSVTVHHERTVHGSSGNISARWRRGYVLAFRHESTIAAERALGFTHSHNDDVQVLTMIGEQTRRREGR